MALDKVIQAILDEGEKEAERILAEGMKEAGKLVSEAKKEAEKIIKEKSDEADNIAERLKVQETARAEIESKKLVLRAQKEALDEVYNEALKRLCVQWRMRLLENILRLKSSEVKGGLVYSNDKDRKTAENLVGAYGARFGGVIDCLGGVVIESSDRSVINDYRLETILKNIWEDSVIEVTSLLWGKK